MKEIIWICQQHSQSSRVGLGKHDHASVCGIAIVIWNFRVVAVLIFLCRTVEGGVPMLRRLTSLWQPVEYHGGAIRGHGGSKRNWWRVVTPVGVGVLCPMVLQPIASHCPIGCHGFTVRWIRISHCRLTQQRAGVFQLLFDDTAANSLVAKAIATSIIEINITPRRFWTLRRKCNIHDCLIHWQKRVGFRDF